MQFPKGDNQCKGIINSGKGALKNCQAKCNPPKCLVQRRAGNRRRKGSYVISSVQENFECIKIHDKQENVHQ